MADERILIVDDVGLNRILLRNILSKSSFCVDEAESGKDALIELSKNRYDLVITDLKMPDIGGKELVDLVRSAKFEDEMGPIPLPIFILCTVHREEVDRTAALQMGFRELIFKPLDGNEILAAIDRALSTSETEFQCTLSGETAALLRSYANRLGTTPEQIVKLLCDRLVNADWDPAQKSLSDLSTFLSKSFSDAVTDSEEDGSSEIANADSSDKYPYSTVQKIP